MITLKQLRYFLALGRHRHFGRAAEECHVSQPALSVQIQELEATLGVALVERRRAGIELTPMGMEIEARARRVMTEAADLMDFARARTETLVGTLRLGVIPSIAPYVLPAALPLLQRRYPRLDLRLRETLTRNLVADLIDGHLDVALLSLPMDDPALEALALHDDAFVLAVPAVRASATAGLEPGEALAAPDLLLLEEGHCLRDQALAVCGTAGIGARRYGASSLTTVMRMVANGYGSTLLPEIAVPVEVHDSDALALFRLGDPEPRRVLGLTWRRTSPRRADFEALGAVMAEAIGGAVGGNRGRWPVLGLGHAE